MIKKQMEGCVLSPPPALRKKSKRLSLKTIGHRLLNRFSIRCHNEAGAVAYMILRKDGGFANG